MKEVTSRFGPGDFAIAKSNEVDKKTKRAELRLVEIVEYDRTFNAYKVLEVDGTDGWYNPSRLELTDNDPIVTRSYYEILNLRQQVKELACQLTTYKNRSFFTKLKEFFTGSK